VRLSAGDQARRPPSSSLPADEGGPGGSSSPRRFDVRTHTSSRLDCVYRSACGNEPLRRFMSEVSGPVTSRGTNGASIAELSASASPA